MVLEAFASEEIWGFENDLIVDKDLNTPTPLAHR